MPAKQATTWFLIAVAAVALYLCYVIAEPFLNPIFAAIVLVIVFYPLHARIESRIPRRNLAAALSTVLVILVVALPAVFLGVTVTRELSQLYQSLNEKSAAEGGFSPYLTHLAQVPLRVVGKYVDVSRFDVRGNLLLWLQQASHYLMTAGARAVSNVFALIVGTVVAFFTLFFFFRDGPQILQRATALLPLSRRQAKRLATGISETIVASVQGGIAVGLIQGLLTGLAFWVLGLASPVLWTIVAALASLVPVVGTGMVWVPGAIILLAEGHWVKALLLVIWGVLVVAHVDTVVRPYVMSGRAKMHNLLIFFALLGGVKAFGIMGLFIGPVVVSVTLAVLDMLREINAAGVESESPEEPMASASE